MFLAPSKSRQIAKIQSMGVTKSRNNIQIKIMMTNPTQEHPESFKAQNQDFKDMMFFAPSRARQRTTNRNIGVPKTSDPIQIKIKRPNPSQEPRESSKAQNEDLKDMYVLCTLKIKTECQNSEPGRTKDQ